MSLRMPILTLVAALSLTAGASHAAPAADVASVEADALTMVNLRRAQVGLSAWAPNAQLQATARGHSNYLALNNLTGHNQNATQFPNGFTGSTVGTRVNASGYRWTAVGENISFGLGDGFASIDGLMTAIYHRFGLLSSRTTEVGLGAVTTHPSFGLALTVVDAATTSQAAPAGWVGLWPPPGFTQTPLSFDSDTEAPDPVPGQNTVGYPVSVQIDNARNLQVQSFTLTTPNNRDLPGRILSRSSDASTPQSASAFIPTEVLQPGLVYTARFRGTADGAPLERTWRFSTPMPQVPTLRGAGAVNNTATVGTGQTFEVLLDGGSGVIQRRGQNNATVLVQMEPQGPNRLRITTATPGRTTLTVTDSLGATASLNLNIVAGAPLPAASPMATSATANGPVSAHSVNLRLQVAQSEVGDLGQVFVIAVVGNTLALLDGNGWQAYNPAAPVPAWSMGQLPSSVVVPVLADLDVRSLCGVQLYIGYGRDVADMLTRGRFGLAHTLCR
jgi:uncharacterized protein YkwD